MYILLSLYATNYCEELDSESFLGRFYQVPLLALGIVARNPKLGPQYINLT